MKHKYLFLSVLTACVFVLQSSQKPSDNYSRDYWIKTMLKIADPVLLNLSNNTLRQNMPVEVTPEGGKRNRSQVSHLEAFGRTLCGIAPWLELGPGGSAEGKLRAKYIAITIKCLKNSVDPLSPDCMNFTGDTQPLVDAAFLAEGLLRAPVQLWGRLDTVTRLRLIDAFKQTRNIKPIESNWLLFSAEIEAALLRYTGVCEMKTIDYAFGRFQEWYKGDGWYGDGRDFHFDYYNSLVIHPMMMDILHVLKANSSCDTVFYTAEEKRWTRHAEQLERLISPEGTYPAFGRSLAYRFGVFHALSQAALYKKLPAGVKTSQVREALTAVISRQISAAGTFDKNGWLTLGFTGHQPELAESYISTGSLYLCSAVFLPLGLPADDPFWTDAPAEWTNKKIWSGKPVAADHAIKN